jgi:hypothetical protein
MAGGNGNRSAGWLAHGGVSGIEPDYHRPLQTFAETISTVVALHFYEIARE